MNIQDLTLINKDKTFSLLLIILNTTKIRKRVIAPIQNDGQKNAKFVPFENSAKTSIAYA